MKVNVLKSRVAFNKVIGFFAVAMLFMSTSCESDDDNHANAGLFDNGVFVLNEGGFQTSNASVSFISHSEDTVYGELFISANAVPGSEIVLGDVLMDMVTVDTLSFLVLNGSQSVMVVNNKTFEYVDEITEGINNPRFAEVANEKVFVSQWGNGGEVVVIDPVDLSVKNTISVGTGPEGISYSNGKIWVANSGGYTFDNTISVIDTDNEIVLETIEVGDCPKDIVFDAFGHAWAVSSGHVTNWATGEGTSPVLNEIDDETYEVLSLMEMDVAVYGRPTRIGISPDAQKVYFGGGYSAINIWAQDVNENVLTSDAIIEVAPYNFGINPKNGNIYCGMSPNFGEPGFVQVYDSEGNSIEKIEENIGVGPAGFIFAN